jgi:enoyl-CoA hydratase
MNSIEVLPPDARGVCHITLNRPDRANAMGEGLVESLLTSLEAAASDGTRLLVLRGAGANFCGGFDLSDCETQSDGDLAMRFIRIEQVFQRLSMAPFLSIARIQGAAYGAGADLVAACDCRLGNASARFRFPGYRFGVALGTSRFTALVGAATARDVLLTGRVVAADEALARGLLTDVLEDDAAEAEINRFAAGVAALDMPSMATLLASTRRALDDADRDLATLVRSVVRPGLRDRLRRYAEASRRK